MNFLETEDVVKQYANHLALDKVSIQVPEGKVFGLLGPNGAGKTTLIRIINRITAPDSGLVRFNGREFQPEDIYQIGYLPEERGLYKKMKVGDRIHICVFHNNHCNTQISLRPHDTPYSL